MEPERRLATVLFTDIVRSTETAGEVGDRAWRELLRRHHAVVRSELARFGGREIGTAGDAFVASFDAPDPAVRCASAIRDAVRALGIEIRSGIHAGELQGSGPSATGIALHVGARVAAKARAGEVLASSTVRELALGSGMRFQARGAHALKGLPGKWRLYAVRGEAARTERKASRGSPTSRAVAVPAPADLARPARERSVAVLPFVDLSPQRDHEYLGDGLTEELINALGKLPGLRVVSRTSVFSLKATPADVREIGQRLGVELVLEGSVRVAGDRLRVVAQLVDASRGYHLWSERYERELRDVFAIQDEISRAIASKLELELLGRGGRPLVEPGTENWEAYILYLKGRYFWNQRTETGLRRAVECFQQAIRMDSSFAPAYAGLADAYGQLRSRGHLDARQALRRERAAILKALEIDETLSEAHASLAWLKLNHEWDWRGAEREFRRAVELNPNDVNAHHWFSHYWMAMGRTDESLTESELALSLDPLDLNLNVHLGWHYLHARDYDRAIEQLRRTADMDDRADMVHLFLGHAYAQTRMFEPALAEYRKHVEATDGSADATVALGYGYALAGQSRDARRVLGQLRRQRANSVSRAALHAALGESDEAFHWLERAYAARAPGLILLKIDPRLDGLRSDPRFDDLLARMALPEPTRASRP